jgi:hypothetical protein
MKTFFSKCTAGPRRVFAAFAFLPWIFNALPAYARQSAPSIPLVLSASFYARNHVQSMGQMPGMPGMPGMKMKGTFGSWPMSREGSGTSWQPDSSPMFMRDLPTRGGFDIGLMGIFQGGYVDDGGKRGDHGFFGNSMAMLMGRKAMGKDILGLHFMSSFDPILDGRRGVPNLFENPFEVNGATVADRKDPHNLVAELAMSFSHPLAKDWSAFFYGGPVGEPALGNVMFLHRPSGLEIPEAPISHDWFDGTHISFGVLTLGAVYQDKWKLEGSAFNGHDPLNLYGIGPIALNSTSGRLSYNPDSNWSLSASYGDIVSDTSSHRLTAGASYSRSLTHGDNLSVTAYFGQNLAVGSPKSNAWLGEATYCRGKDAYFARLERVDKDELVEVPPGIHTINKLLFGAVHNLASRDGFSYAIGAYAGLYSFPSALKPEYGNSPVTLGVFLRVRPEKM